MAAGRLSSRSVEADSSRPMAAAVGRDRGTGLVSHQILDDETWVVGRGDRFAVPPRFWQ